MKKVLTIALSVSLLTATLGTTGVSASSIASKTMKQVPVKVNFLLDYRL